MQTASWIIRRRSDGAIIMETWQQSIVDKINTALYEAVPIGEYLGSINTADKRAALALQYRVRK